jgi:hypothetical protein
METTPASEAANRSNEALFFIAVILLVFPVPLRLGDQRQLFPTPNHCSWFENEAVRDHEVRSELRRVRECRMTFVPGW